MNSSSFKMSNILQDKFGFLIWISHRFFKVHTLCIQEQKKSRTDSKDQRLKMVNIYHQIVNSVVNERIFFNFATKTANRLS